MPGRYVGQAFRTGNRIDSRGALVRAISMKFLAMLERRMAVTGQKKGHWIKTTRDGTKFICAISKNGPVPVYMVRVITPGIEEEAILAGFFFESGLLLGRQYYLSAVAVTYFQGDGTQYLPENTYHHIQGKWNFTNESPNWAATVPKINFLPGESQYSSQGHTSSLSTLESNPSMYTGLMRLAVQGRLARGTVYLGVNPVSDLFVYENYAEDAEGAYSIPLGDAADFSTLSGSVVGGTDFTINGSAAISKVYDHYGLVRTEDFVYFVVRTTYTECKACRMTTAPIVEDLRQRLINQQYTSDEDRIKMEAVVLSTLQPELVDGALASFDLLTQSELTPTFTPPIGFHLAYGWHYSYPAGPISDEFECAIIRHGTTFFPIGHCLLAPSQPSVQYTAYKTIISFSFSKPSQDDPWEIEAAVEVTVEGTPWHNYPDAQTIWIPDSTHNSVISFWQRGCELAEESAPLYCWYDTTGYRDVWINSESDPTADEIHIPPQSIRRSCDMQWAQPTISLYNLGGAYGVRYSLDGGDTSQILLPEFVDGAWNHNIIPLNTTYTEWISDVSITPTEPTTDLGFTATGAAGNQCIPASLPGSPAPDIWGGTIDVIGMYEDWENSRSIYSQKVEAANYVPYLSTALIIPRLNSEAVAIMTRKAKDRDFYDNYGDATIGTPQEALTWSTKMKAVYPPGSTVCETINCEFNGGFQVGRAAEIGSGYGWILTMGGYNTTNFYLLNNTLEHIEDTSQRENTAVLVIAGEELELQPEQDDRWDGYFNKDWNFGFDAIHFSTPGSFAGDVKYPTKGTTPSEPTISGDYADEEEILNGIEFESDKVMWTGWA